MFLDTDSYLALPRDPSKWIVKDLLPVGGLVNFYGQPKTAKSFAALGMAQAIASGAKRWLNFPVRKHGKVAYLQIDTPRSLWAPRLRGMQRAGYSLANLYHSDSLLAPYPFNIVDPEQHALLRNALAELQPVAVILDTLREVHPGDENDSTVMRNVMSSIIAACRPAGIVLVSHSRKGSAATAVGADDLMGDARGSSYVSGKMDTVVRFTSSMMTYKGRGKGEGTLTIEQNEDTGLVQLNADAAEYIQLIQGLSTTLRAENPKISIKAIAETIKEHTDYRQLRTIQTDVKDYLLSLRDAQFEDEDE